jgi:hypothetical protein
VTRGVKIVDLVCLLVDGSDPLKLLTMERADEPWVGTLPGEEEDH